MTTTEQRVMDRVNQFIDDNLADPELSIDVICQAIGISRSNLYRLIRDQSQLSTTLYIRQRRLEKARQLLGTTDLRVVEISERVGIANPQNFTKYFTEAFGVNPTEFRRRLSTEPIEALSAEPAEPVVYGPDESTADISEPEAHKQATNRWPGRRLLQLRVGWLVAAVLLLISAVWGSWYWLARRDAEHAIAVLPFRNMGPAGNAYFGDGMVEQIHSALTLIESLKVISRTSTEGYAQSRQPSPKIGKELGVDYLLDGQVRQQGNRVKIFVELIRADENRTIWSQTYEGETKEAVSFTRAIVRQVADQLGERLSTVTRQRIDQAPTHNPQAFTEFLKGQYLMRNRTKEGLDASLVNFDRALALDTTFSDAFAYKGLAYMLMGSEGYRNPDSCSRLAETNVLSAVRLDPQNALAYATLAQLYQERNKWEQAGTFYQIALRYRPNEAIINYWYSLWLRSVGQMDRAIEYSTKAVNLDPLFPVILIGHIGNLSYAGRFADAKKAIDEGQPLHGNLYSWYWAVGYYYIIRQQPELALRAFEQGLRLNPSSTHIQGRIAYIKALLGQPEMARGLLNSMPDVPSNYPDRAILYAGLGDRERCLQYLEKGVETGWLPNYVKVSPHFVSYRNEPRFQAVLRKAGLATSAVQ
ncbi:helix-turn-helix domain-containing protein [Nibrella viscosa]